MSIPPPRSYICHKKLQLSRYPLANATPSSASGISSVGKSHLSGIECLINNIFSYTISSLPSSLYLIQTELQSIFGTPLDPLFPCIAELSSVRNNEVSLHQNKFPNYQTGASASGRSLPHHNALCGGTSYSTSQFPDGFLHLS